MGVTNAISLVTLVLSSSPPPSIAHAHARAHDPAFSPYRPHLTYPSHQTHDGDPRNAGQTSFPYRSALTKVSRNQERPMRYHEHHRQGAGQVKPPDSRNCNG